jgi:hypothetical protein
MHGRAAFCSHDPGAAASHYAARRLRLAAAGGSEKRPSSQRPSPTENVYYIVHCAGIIDIFGLMSALYKKNKPPHRSAPEAYMSCFGRKGFIPATYLCC